MGSVSIPEHLDVVIVGAGLSGINTAYRLQRELPDTKFAIFEANSIIGGTWAFWKYPGVRSDSSLGVFGFTWYPWPHDEDFASAPLIRDYLEAAAVSEGIDKKIRFSHRVTASDWSTAEQLWTMDVEVNGSPRQFKTKWIISCGGYYSYEKPLPAVIPGIEDFGGEVVHPQFWTDDITYEGKKVVIVGSGATSITMMPAIAKKAAHTVMLQRSPSYVMTLPIRDKTTLFLKKIFPLKIAAKIDWWRRMLLEFLFVQFLTRWPNAGRKVLTNLARKQLPKGYPVDVHFKPRYGPFDQRLGLVPDGDFFKALHRENCEVVTDIIDTVTKTGIKLKSGRELEADMIITATGLYMVLLGGQSPTVDGKEARLGGRYAWRSCMVEGIPNCSSILSYTIGTWTPGADIRARLVFGVMKEMKRLGATSAMPKMDPKERESLPRLPAVPNSSGYLVNARDRLPISSGKDPWNNGMHWFSDAWRLYFGNLRAGMEYTIPAKAKDI